MGRRRKQPSAGDRVRIVYERDGTTLHVVLTRTAAPNPAWDRLWRILLQPHPSVFGPATDDATAGLAAPAEGPMTAPDDPDQDAAGPTPPAID